MGINDLIYGKDQTQGIVASEVNNNILVNYYVDNGKLLKQTRPFYYYVLLEDYDRHRDCGRLEGRNDFQYFVKFEDKQEAYQYCKSLESAGKKFWRCYNPIESAMLREGFTYYKGMSVDDVSVLSFDIETTGVVHDKNSFVTLISNTFRSRNGDITKRLFAFDEYDNPKQFIESWCKWVREMDPDIMVGHNVFAFDFPYLAHFAKLQNTKIRIGRNASAIKIDRNSRKFRKDGSQSYDYNNVHVFGREIVDTFFLSMKFDVTRKYPSYGLKAIIAYEGMEKADRQYWDFSKNKEPWANTEDWAKFKQYAMDDADDALGLFDLMVPQYFYYAQSIPKPFQEIINTATGSQVNSFMVRGYLQNSEAIPAPSEAAEYEGATVIGNPGIYTNVFKVDVASLYPSIMMQYEITDRKKDPQNRFLQAVEFFTKQRLEDKRMAQETGERLYKDLSDGRKIMINSFYGFLGATGLNFNYPKGAAEITRKGRDILQRALDWANVNEYPIVNADTDSISYVAPVADKMVDHIARINSLFPDKIRWEDDGIYDAVIVVKAKNYALKQGDKITIKGSALKATMKERELVNLLESTIYNLLVHRPNEIHSYYDSLVRDIRDGNIDISQWTSKKTITKAVLYPKRTNEQRILDALNGKHIQEGDKVRMFYKTDTELCLEENFDGEYEKERLYEKLYKTISVLAPVLDMENFPNYKLKRNKEKLETL